MSESMNETEEAVLRALLRDPVLQSLFSRSPDYRYWEYRGYHFCWTMERLADGRYASWVYRPVGPGARSGKPRRWRATREVRHATRKAAKARAARLFDSYADAHPDGE